MGWIIFFLILFLIYRLFRALLKPIVDYIYQSLTNLIRNFFGVSESAARVILHIVIIIVIVILIFAWQQKWVLCVQSKLHFIRLVLFYPNIPFLFTGGCSFIVFASFSNKSLCSFESLLGVCTITVNIKSPLYFPIYTCKSFLSNSKLGSCLCSFWNSKNFISSINHWYFYIRSKRCLSYCNRYIT